MSFVYTKCYKCNKRVKVNDAEDAWICKFCKKPFVIEKAMKLYRENSQDGEHVRKKVEVKKASANVSADSMIPENIVITMPIEETPAVKPDIKRAELSVSKAEPKNPESSAPKVELKKKLPNLRKRKLQSQRKQRSPSRSPRLIKPRKLRQRLSRRKRKSLKRMSLSSNSRISKNT